MRLVNCKNGHFYDAEKYKSCPHCEEGDFTKSGDDVYEDDATMAGDIDYEDDLDDMATMPTSPAKSYSGVTKPDTDRAWPNNNLVDDQKTMRFNDLATGKKADFTVGWLVEVAGEDIGKSYRLVEGKNFIGRDTSMDVILGKDISVSRIKHAIILFEPRSGIFLVQPGDSKELFYLNEKVVLNTETIQAYDRLLIGKTVLVFVPFCGEKFSWEKELKKD